MTLHDKPLRLVTGSRHLEVLDEKDRPVMGSRGINDQQAIDRMKRVIGHLLKERQ